MPARKRHSAFDDFPIDSQAQPQESERARKEKPPALFQESGAILAKPEPPPEVERIERLKPSEMIPDRFQPRRLLPTPLRQAFYSGQIDCYRAAAEWMAIAKNDSGIQNEVDRLMAMGLSFEEHGQIKPITGSWVHLTNGKYIFQIETGERRYWAACLQYVAQNLPEEPLLRVEVVTNPTRQRQVLENQHAEAPSDVGRACEVAALILSELNIQPDPNTQHDEYDYFRQAKTLSMTGKLWDRLSGIMQLTRPRMIQLLNILSLPTPLLDLTDRYRVPERVIREVLRSPRNQWETLLRSSIQNSLTSDQVAELAQRPGAEKREPSGPRQTDAGQNALKAIKRFTYLMEELEPEMQASVLDHLARDLVNNERAEGLINLMHDFAERVHNLQRKRQRKY